GAVGGGDAAERDHGLTHHPVDEEQDQQADVDPGSASAGEIVLEHATGRTYRQSGPLPRALTAWRMCAALTAPAHPSCTGEGRSWWRGKRPPRACCRVQRTTTRSGSSFLSSGCRGKCCASRSPARCTAATSPSANAPRLAAAATSSAKASQSS